MKILIADDDPVSRRVLSAALTALGHDVVETGDGSTALEALARPEAPTLAIVDWMMPGVDGLEVCRQIRQRPGRYIYTVLLTARDSTDDMVHALESGADDFLTKPFNAAELRARLRAGERVLALQDDLLRSHEVLRHKASHDRLTGLWNRGRILDELARELRRNRRELSFFAIALVDVDQFKQINDHHGHASGDAVLQQISQRIVASLRTSDSVGRYGGEEFLLILPNADVESGRDVAERVRAAIEAQPMAGIDGGLSVTISLGVACGDRMATADDLIGTADRALYRAKANGRNRVEVA